MADKKSRGWVWALIFVVGFILIAAIVIIVVVALESEGTNKKCTSTSDCNSDRLICTQEGKCKIINGDTCETDDQCASGICSGFVCVSGTGITGTNCITRGTGACSAGEICDTTSGKCLSGYGNPCLLASDCAFAKSVCVQITGGTGFTGPTGPGICLGGSGAGCNTGTDCVSGSCVGNVCTGPSAASLPAQSMTLLGAQQTNGLAMAPRQGATFLDTDTMTTPRVNATFNIASAPTRTEMVDNFCTPSPCELRNPFKKIRKDMVISDAKQSPVIDVTNYSNSTLALTQDGRIMRETRNGTRDRVANNVRLVRLESFNGTLYGISADGRVFALNNDTFDTRKWTWTLTSFPVGVMHTSATLNGRHFWVQTNDTGLLYDRKLRVVERVPIKNKKRVYGNDRKTYIEIDTENNTGMLFPNRSRVNNVAGAIITHDNQLKVLKPSQTGLFSDIRLINWTPTYIKRCL